MTGTRARAPAAKDERRRALKQAACVVFDGDRPFAEVTMADVVREAGLAKGTVYLYFPTKEALFLEILTDDLAAWLGVLLPALRALPADASAGVIATIIADSLCARTRLLRLLALLHVVLEANIDAPTARAFKQALAAGLGRASAEVEQALPRFGPGDFARLMLRTHALVVGLAAMARPAPVVAEVLTDPALAWMRVDLRTELTEALAGWLRGWRRA